MGKPKTFDEVLVEPSVDISTKEGQAQFRKDLEGIYTEDEMSDALLDEIVGWPLPEDVK